MKTLRTRKKHLARSGFTLLELLIVLAIIVSILAMVAPNLIGNQQEARVMKTQGEVRTIESAVKMKASKMGGTYDTGGAEVIDQLGESFEYNGMQYKAPMEDFVNQDDWGNPFQYAYDPNTDDKPRIWSMGPNGTDDGGEGDDIINIRKQNQ